MCVCVCGKKGDGACGWKGEGGGLTDFHSVLPLQKMTAALLRVASYRWAYLTPPPPLLSEQVLPYAAVTRAKTLPRLLKLGTSLRLFLPCDCTTKTPDIWENPILQSWA